MDEQYNFLVLVEVVKVKSFLFASAKLKSIRGASFILDLINLKRAEELFEEYQDKGTKIYFGGGNNRALFSDLDSANEFKKRLEDEYYNRAPGVKLASTIKERQAGESLAELMQRGMEEIISIKNEGFSKNISANPFAKYCSLCGEDLVNCYSSSIQTLLCIDCENRIEEGNKINRLKKNLALEQGFEEFIYNKFYEQIEVEELELPENISQIADQNNFIGFIYADGNRLGAFLRKFNNDYLAEVSDKQYLEQQRRFSEALDQGTKEAVIEAVREEIEIKEGIKCPLEFIIAGGDDLILVVPGNKALAVAKSFMEKFEEKVNNKLKKDQHFKQILEKDKLRITISTGLAIAKSSYPMSFLFEQAAQLQKEAKLRSNTLYQSYSGEEQEQEHNYSTIDFDIISSSSVRHIKEKRKEVYLQGDKYLTLRPYLVANEEDKEEQLSQLLYLDHLIESVQEFKKINFPRVKLRQFYEALYLEQKDAILESLRLVSKLGAEDRKLLKKLYRQRGSEQGVFPWIKLDKEAELIVSDIADIVESYDFIVSEVE